MKKTMIIILQYIKGLSENQSKDTAVDEDDRKLLTPGRRHERMRGGNYAPTRRDKTDYHKYYFISLDRRAHQWWLAKTIVTFLLRLAFKHSESFLIGSKKYISHLVLCCILTQVSLMNAYTFTLMIDPAGDAKHTGREIGDSFERGITLQCAEKLKSMIEERYPDVRVVLTRFPGETLQPLQNANFGNRLDVNFYLSIHFYHDQATRPSLYVYAFSYGDDFVTKTTDLTFYPYDKAYLISTDTTHAWATIMQKHLSSSSYQKQFDCKGCFYLPFAPLIGVKAPAVALEIGLKTKHDWQLYLEPIIASITPLINKV